MCILTNKKTIMRIFKSYESAYIKLSSEQGEKICLLNRQWLEWAWGIDLLNIYFFTSYYLLIFFLFVTGMTAVQNRSYPTWRRGHIHSEQPTDQPLQETENIDDLLLEDHRDKPDKPTFALLLAPMAGLQADSPHAASGNLGEEQLNVQRHQEGVPHEYQHTAWTAHVENLLDGSSTKSREEHQGQPLPQAVNPRPVEQLYLIIQPGSG